MEMLNPLRYFTHNEYQSLWSALFATILHGFWAKTFAVLFLFLAFWFGVRRQRFQLGLLYFMLSVMMTYGATVLGCLKMH